MSMVGRLRQDLKVPDLPVVVVQLSDPDNRPDSPRKARGWHIVQAAQQGLQLKCVVTVTAVGLQQNADRLHLSTEAHRALGIRIAEAMHRLRSGGCGADQRAAVDASSRRKYSVKR